MKHSKSVKRTILRIMLAFPRVTGLTKFGGGKDANTLRGGSCMIKECPNKTGRIGKLKIADSPTLSNKEMNT